MIRRACFALALVLVAACDRGSSGPSLRLAQPSAVAVFSGYTDRHTSLWPYAAVANSAQDELMLFDAVDDRVVAAAIVLRPLSIPVGAPRPALLAAASFAPPADQLERPSLLVVATAGSSHLQLIRTWHATDCGAVCPTGPGLADEEPIDLGSEIIALVAAPAVDAGGAVVPDRVRVVAAVAGDGPGQAEVVIVDYEWTGDPGTGSAASVGPGQVIHRSVVGFEALSLAIDPRDARFAYAATIDPIPPSHVLGVARIDLQGTPPSLAVAGIDAKAPTRLVAAYTLRERSLGWRGAYDQYRQTPAAELEQTFRPDEVARVYAWRDPAACGPTTPVACGIAVLDPEAGDVLEDPWNEGQTPKRYLPPITLPSRPVAMIVGPPAAFPPDSDNLRPPGDDPAAPARFMSLDPITPRVTTGVLLLPSENGRNYFADLARWETPSSVYELAPGSGTGVSSFRPSSTARPRIGFYPPSASLAWDASANAATYLRLTPGFTPTDDWTVTFQGYLPDFAASRAAQVAVEDAGAGTLRVAFQAVPPGTPAPPPTQVVNVYDPAYGVRVGDIVEFWTDGRSGSDTPACPDTTRTTGTPDPPIEGKIIAISPPEPGYPGGSVVVQKGDCVPWAQGPLTGCESEKRGPWTDIPDEDCWNLLPSGPRQVRIRAGSGTAGSEEFVVVGAATGYAGRAVSSPDTPAATPTYTLSNEDEAALVADCPLIPYPSNPAAVPCDDACRATCEQAAIARRARRLHLTSLYCYRSSTSGTHCENNFPDFELPEEPDPAAPFPPPEGPALAFSLGWKPLPGAPEQLLTRDTRVTFHTRSGRVPASRWGGGGNNGPATLPTGGAYFDRTAKRSWNRTDERYRFFVPYVGNVVLDLSPARDNGATRVLR